VPRLPAFEPLTRVNRSPHVVILGAGASRAAFPEGDANKKRLPLMVDLPECLDLRAAINSAGFSSTADFESVYDEIATSGRCSSLKSEIETRVRSYFESLVLADEPTLYDYLLLSLRKQDLIATFNWDPFLVRAFNRNRGAADLPQLAFLHGNVEIGVCIKDRVKGFRGESCQKCGEVFRPTTLLYPVRNKDYNSDAFIANEWAVLEKLLKEAYLVTIFGYSAPTTDAAAVELMSQAWAQNPTFEFGQVNIVDIKPKEELEKTWERFFCRSHYGIHERLSTTWMLRHPRRSGEALAMATLQNDPWRDNPFPEFKELSQLHAWIAPLVVEENKDRFTGNPCLKSQDFSPNTPRKSKTVATDLVLDWLKLMCQGELIPPFCVDLVLKDGIRYHLHSVLRFEDNTATLCARIWDLRALHAQEINELKQKLNQIRTRADLTPAEAVHPKLDWANIRVRYNEIAYCIEWHDRIWPDDKRSKIPVKSRRAGRRARPTRKPGTS
jgi:hypothetical protein